MQTRRLVRPLVFAALLAGSATAALAQGEDAQARRVMTVRAQQLAMGAPRPETRDPVRTPAPRSEGWFQRFDRGNLYWRSGDVPYAVWGTILDTWGGTGWEQGPLGFPVSDEVAVPATRTGDRYQVFENGLIYWHGERNAAVVLRPTGGVAEPHGTIGQRYQALSGRRSNLGAPRTAEIAVTEPFSADRYQIFDRGAIYWHAATNQAVELVTPAPSVVATSSDATRADGGPVARPASDGAGGSGGPVALPPARQSGRFRVVLTGFSVHRETADDVLERDGKRDEVFVTWQARTVDRRGNTQFDGGPRQSVVMGDPTGRPSRVTAGTANPGGLQTNDVFPTPTPWVRQGEPQRDRLPLVLWEGELAWGDGALLVVPAVWEWDGPPDLLTSIAHAVNGLPVADLVTRLPAMLDGDGGFPRRGATREGALASILSDLPGGLASEVRVSGSFLGDPRDRPIGMRADGTGGFRFVPRALSLNYGSAVLASGFDFGFGPGVVPVRYTDAPALQGDYTLYVQVEKLP